MILINNILIKNEFLIRFSAIVIFLVFTVPSCMFCCIFYVRKANAKKRKIIRIQQSRTVRPISEQSQYRIMGKSYFSGQTLGPFSFGHLLKICKRFCFNNKCWLQTSMYKCAFVQYNLNL